MRPRSPLPPCSPRPYNTITSMLVKVCHEASLPLTPSCSPCSPLPPCSPHSPLPPRSPSTLQYYKYGCTVKRHHWWLVRVTLVVDWLFLPQNFGPVVGTYKGLLRICECTLGGGSIFRWWGHLTTIGGNQTFSCHRWWGA